MIRKIISLGKYSGVLSIPKEFMRKLGWRKGQYVEVSTKHKTLRVKDCKNK